MLKNIPIRNFCKVIFTLVSQFAFAQANDTIFIKNDTVKLNEITVSAYLAEHSLFRIPSSANVLGEIQLMNQPSHSLVASLNTVPGVRMEERSPGSYRLSIRGSLLRSPFGVRNVKVYVDEFPLTNAGGDTYLNLLDKFCIGKIEVLKGPDGSLFGANSGGVVRITPVKYADSTRIEINAEGGSYQMLHQQASLQIAMKKNVTAISEAWQSANGYRDNSALQRKYFQVAHRWSYRPFSQLRVLLFYSDLEYKTPGGLTLEQFNDDPSAARYPTATLPGAEEQKAGVVNKTFFGGIVNDIKITKHLRHVLAVFASHTDFKNPFITNYETRNELSFGLRTWMEGRIDCEKINMKMNIGAEFQQTRSEISNHENNSGIKGALEVSDNLKAGNNFIFTQATMELLQALIIEPSLSFNLNRFFYSNIYPVKQSENKVFFQPQIMPRVAIAYSLKNKMTWRFIISRGYSVPTLSELRSSDNIINTDLQPENGWNYEVGYRVRHIKSGFWWDVAFFYYHLQNAIVTRVNHAGQEYFINAGGTRQPGIESQVNFEIIKERQTGGVRQLVLNSSYAYHHFTFSDYQDEMNNYFGNALTGVPRHVAVSSLLLKFPLGFYFFIQHNYTARIPLDDTNSTFANDYHLMQIKIGWESMMSNRLAIGLFATVDNLLNQRYSLGNDLNAAGQRYYNAASPRNYSGGMRILFQ